MRFGSISSVDGKRQRNGPRRGGFDVGKFLRQETEERVDELGWAAREAARVRESPGGAREEGGRMRRREKQSQADTRATDRRIDRRRDGDSESCEIDNMLGDIPIILSSPPSEERTGRVVKLQIADWKFSGCDHPASVATPQESVLLTLWLSADNANHGTRAAAGPPPTWCALIHTIATFPINPCHLE